MEYFSYSVEDTQRLAMELAKDIKGGEIILLEGDLGTGKTTFTKAFAKALGVTANVTSPTFTFMKEYFGKFPIYHFDMYRVSDEDELYELGLNEYLESKDGVCVIEWNKFRNISKPIISLKIERINENARKITVSGRI